MYEAVEFIEEEVVPGRSAPIPTENILGSFASETDAVDRARAARIGGDLVIRSQPGRGTAVALTWQPNGKPNAVELQEVAA